MEASIRDQVIRALNATTLAENQEAASKYLDEVSKMDGFAPLILDILSDNALDLAVRQAAVIYLKNLIKTSWVIDEEGDQKISKFNDQDKAYIRSKIIDCVVGSPEQITVHLCSSLYFIIRSDFPTQWSDLVGKILALLQNHEGSSWLGALKIIHRLAKVYEYKRNDDRSPFLVAMNQILPILYDRFSCLLSDDSKESCVLQKIVLKILYSMTRFSLNTAMIDLNDFDNWLILFLTVVQRDIKEDLSHLNDDEKEATVWWKCRKWALKNLTRIFERYGSKGQVDIKYQAYAVLYFQRFAADVINCLLKILADRLNGVYVSERVLYLVLSHMSQAVSHSELWILIKPHFEGMSQHVIFPTLQYTDDDEELWNDDPEAYIKSKHDIYEELHNPASASASLLQAASKRRGILERVIFLAVEKLGDPNANDRETYGAMNVIGILASNLTTNKNLKKSVEKVIQSHIYSRMDHPQKFIRVRACMVIKEMCEVSYSGRFLQQLVGKLVDLLIKDTELPVKIEAALAIESLLSCQEGKMTSALKPHVREVMMEILRLLIKTKLDDLTPVIDQIIEQFQDDVIPFAYDVAKELAELFHRLTFHRDEDLVEDTTITVVGVLESFETLLSLVEEKPEILNAVEEVVGRCIVSVLQNDASEYYEEIFSLTESLTVSRVTPSMWQVCGMIYEALAQDHGFLSDAMPTMHNYLTVDTETFLSKQEHVEWLLNTCQRVLADKEAGDLLQEHAAKLLECFVLQCQSKIDLYIPIVMMMTMNRLGGEFEEHSTELKAQLLTILLACLYYNMELFLRNLTNFQQPNVNIFEWFFAELMNSHSSFLGIHNRKLLIFGLMSALRLPTDIRPQALVQNPTRVIEICLTLFEGIQRCVKAIAEENRATESEDESSDDEEMSGRNIDYELNDSDDDVDEAFEDTLEYRESLETLKKIEKKAGNVVIDTALLNKLNEFGTDSENSEEHHDFVEETALESYDTPLDSEENGLNVYVVFKLVLEEIQRSDQELFVKLTGSLNQEKSNELQELFAQCNKQEELENSKKLARTGGYVFDASVPIPNAFNFSST